MLRSCQSLLLAITSVLVGSASARIAPLEGTDDIQALALTATFIFHGKVTSITPDRGYGQSRIATLEVDRWYKGTSQQATVHLAFLYPGFMGGHDCIDLSRNTSWLIFAKEDFPGLFKFSEDCQGGLPMSSILATTTSTSWMQQLQDDLVAGLRDDDPESRLHNIQRLGALKQRSSHSALQQFIAKRSETEMQWATFAILRSGDLSILPTVRQIALQQDDARMCGMPDSCDLASELITSELRYLSEPEAIPTLRIILKSSRSESYRLSAAEALARLKDPLSVPVFAERLDDTERSVRYQSLAGMEKNLEVSSCTLPKGWQEEDVDSQIALCKEWWNTEGKQKWLATKH